MITVWISFSRTTQVIPSFCGGCADVAFASISLLARSRCSHGCWERCQEVFSADALVDRFSSQSSKMVLSVEPSKLWASKHPSGAPHQHTRNGRSSRTCNKRHLNLLFSATFYDSSVNLQCGQTPWQDSCQSTSYLRLLLHLEENRQVSGSPGSDVCPCHGICSDAMWWTTWPKLRRWKRQKLH